MSQINNAMKIYDWEYALLLKVNTCEEQLKWLLGKRNNSPNFEIFMKVFRFFHEFD